MSYSRLVGILGTNVVNLLPHLVYRNNSFRIDILCQSFDQNSPNGTRLNLMPFDGFTVCIHQDFPFEIPNPCHCLFTELFVIIAFNKVCLSSDKQTLHCFFGKVLGRVQVGL